MITKFFILMMMLEKFCQSTNTSKAPKVKYSELDEHTLVTDSEVFPFVAAILKRAAYLSAGALIADEWVLTAGDSFYTVRESSRTLRVRLGSINYKKGGIVRPVKYIEIHPLFDDRSPIFDVALIKLAQPVRYSHNLKSIRLQKYMKQPEATHFIVTSWHLPKANSDETRELKSMELIKRQRLLTVTHLHPVDYEFCASELTSLNIDHPMDMMCLDSGAVMDPCIRDVGAPVVLNGILWGIISSWRPASCENGIAGSSFVTLVSSPNVTQWIHAILNGHPWIV